MATESPLWQKLERANPKEGEYASDLPRIFDSHRTMSAEISEPFPEPENTGVEPTQGTATPKFEVVPPEEDRRRVLSLASTMDDYTTKGLSPGQLAFVKAQTYQLEHQNTILRNERDQASRLYNEATAKAADSAAEVRVLKERLKNWTSMSVPQSVAIGLGGVLLGAAASDLLNTVRGYGAAAGIIGALLFLVAFVPQIITAITSNKQ